MSARPHLVVGVGVTGAAVAAALRRHAEPVLAVDDRPTDETRARATAAGVELVEAPTDAELRALVRGAVDVLPAPGLPGSHPVFAIARDERVPIRSEFDLAAEWDARPIVAVTGTNGKTTVVSLVREMLQASGVHAIAVGNTETPLVAALDDPSIDVFVVEASSFRLAHSVRFVPRVATWLNFAPDHLDSHADIRDYELAKARIYRDQSPDDIAIGNADDVVVARHLREAPARHVTFGLESGDFRVAAGVLVTAGGDQLLRVDQLPRSLPHDVANALAASATALAGGATLAGVQRALAAFRGLPHRVELVGEAGGVRFYDDSKATAPHATLAALRGFESVVLIAGGRNKGLDLGELASAASHIRAVVAIGEAANDVEQAFDGIRPVRVATSMDEAVQTARSLASPGDAVVLSPACASFDWYRSYGERGNDFQRAVAELEGVELANGSGAHP